MSWFGRFGNKDRTSSDEQKSSAVGTIVYQSEVGNPVWTEHRYDQLAREAYILNAVAFRCVKMISVCAANIGWVLEDNTGELLDSHPLLDLLDRPSPTMGGTHFFEALYSYLLLAGNSYIEGVGPNNKPYLELYTHRPDRMKVLAGKFGMPSGFEYNWRGTEHRWDVDPLTGACDILHVKEFHPTDDWYGQSRVIPGAMGIDRHNAASAHNKALLDNGARPAGMMVFKPVIVDGKPVSAPDDILAKAERELMLRHTGPKNAGRPMVLNGNVNWEEMGLTPKDMDFDQNKQDAARDICLAFGVPPLLVVRGDATYNNIREAKLEFYEDTVLPLAEKVRDEFNHWITPRYGDGFKLGYDYDSVSALEPRREIKRTTTMNLLDKGVIDNQEARDELGYGERDPNAVQTIDSQVLTALVGTVETTGITPLYRYMRSVGLLEPGMTEEQLLESALAMISDAEDEDEETEDDLIAEGEQPKEKEDPDEDES